MHWNYTIFYKTNSLNVYEAVVAEEKWRINETNILKSYESSKWKVCYHRINRTYNF